MFCLFRLDSHSTLGLGVLSIAFLITLLVLEILSLEIFLGITLDFLDDKDISSDTTFSSLGLFLINVHILASSIDDNFNHHFILFVTQFTHSCPLPIVCNAFIMFLGVNIIQAVIIGIINAGFANIDTTHHHNNICCAYCHTLDFMAVSTAIHTFNHFISSVIQGIIFSNLSNLDLLASFVRFLILLNALSFNFHSLLNQSFFNVFTSSNMGQY